MKARPVSTNQLEPRFNEAGDQVASGLDPQGREINDPVPLSPPVGYETPATLEAIVERLVRSRDLAQLAEKAGVETFDEADDFEVEDEDYDPRFPETIYEAYFEAKSKRRAQAEARRQSEAIRTTSEDLVSPVSPEKKVEKPIASTDADTSGTGESTSVPSGDRAK